MVRFLKFSKKRIIVDDTAGSTSDSERDFSDSSLPEKLLPDGHGRQGYSQDQLRTFLGKTKGKRDVVVEDYFPNGLLLIGTVASSFRIVSLNLNRVRDIKKRSLLYEVRKTKQIDKKK